MDGRSALSRAAGCFCRSNDERFDSKEDHARQFECNPTACPTRIIKEVFGEELATYTRAPKRGKRRVGGTHPPARLAAAATDERPGARGAIVRRGVRACTGAGGRACVTPSASSSGRADEGTSTGGIVA